MCGIFGFVEQKSITFQKDTVKKLLLAAQSRGKEASGLAIQNQHQIAYFKSPVSAEKLVKTKSFNKFIDDFSKNNVKFFMGQARLATHGFQAKNDNNQPIESENLLLVHNGIITNYKELWSTISSENPPELDTKVLIELIQKNWEKFDDWSTALQKTYQAIEGSASLIIFNNTRQEVTISTNTGSLYWSLIDELGGYYFASEQWMLEQIQSDLTKKSLVQHLLPGQAIVFKANDKNQELIDLTKKNNKNEKSKINNFSNKIEVVDYSKTLNLKNKTISKHYQIENDLVKIKKHCFQDKKIKEIKRCSCCILPETTPFINFDKNGVCNYCHQHKKIKNKGVEELKKLIAPYRKKNGQIDCLIAFSGGRDSSYGLHFLKKELGLNPIAYTYDWGMVTDIARRNQARMVSKLGIEHVVISADITKKRQHINRHIKAWLKNPELGMVPLFMEGDKQCEFYADQLMKKYNLDLMFFCRGNEFENEEFKAGHCGVQDADPGGVIHHLALKNKFKMASYYFKQYLKNPSYFNVSLFDTILAFFTTYIQPHNYAYLWHYIPWDEEKIISTLKNEYNWETPTETDSTWRTDDGSSAFYNYIYYAVQGFTENDSFRSRQIREGILTREEALKLVEKENKLRPEALKWYFDQVGLDGDEVLSQVDKIKTLY